MPALNALLLGYVMYRSGLVPRVIPTMGFIGAPLLLASFAATFLGLTDQVPVVSGIAVIPIFFWSFRSASTWPSRGSSRRTSLDQRPLPAVHAPVPVT